MTRAAIHGLMFHSCQNVVGIRLKRKLTLETIKTEVKLTPVRSDRNKLKNKFSKTCFFLLSTCVGRNNLFCGTFTCLLSVGNSFKTCIISVYLGKALETLFSVQQIHSNF